MVGTKTTGPALFLRQAVMGPIRAAVFTGIPWLSYLAGAAGDFGVSAVEESGAGDFINCFWIVVGPEKDFT